ncbi:hypothetical protein TRVA0_036S00870 [Trichomonascus vanleenenianus]|uniref:uncharacterized protein n=1 Tax=Trichomonascus vanleenenianus TaxID=2268995 RepID=UPI003ECB774D
MGLLSPKSSSGSENYCSPEIQNHSASAQEAKEYADRAVDEAHEDSSEQIIRQIVNTVGRFSSSPYAIKNQITQKIESSWKELQPVLVKQTEQFSANYKRAIEAQLDSSRTRHRRKKILAKLSHDIASNKFHDQMMASVKMWCGESVSEELPNINVTGFKFDNSSFSPYIRTSDVAEVSGTRTVHGKSMESVLSGHQTLQSLVMLFGSVAKPNEGDGTTKDDIRNQLRQLQTQMEFVED